MSRLSSIHSCSVLAFTLAALAPLLLGGCGDKQDRYEDVGKLRAIGVQTTPAAASPSTEASPQTMTLTFYAALPPGQDVTATPYIDPNAQYGLATPIEIVSGSSGYEDHPNLRIYHVQAQLTVPTADKLVFGSEASPYARLRYGMKLEAAGGDEDTVVGDALVYPAGAPELTTAQNSGNAQIDILVPTPGATVAAKDQELNAAITGNGDEKMRVGWFASGGKVKNRNAIQTKWEASGSGSFSLLVTARGLKSGAFTYKVVDVTVE